MIDIFRSVEIVSECDGHDNIECHRENWLGVRRSCWYEGFHWTARSLSSLRYPQNCCWRTYSVKNYFIEWISCKSFFFSKFLHLKIFSEVYQCDNKRKWIGTRNEIDQNCKVSSRTQWASVTKDSIHCSRKIYQGKAFDHLVALEHQVHMILEYETSSVIKISWCDQISCSIWIGWPRKYV